MRRTGSRRAAFGSTLAGMALVVATLITGTAGAFTTTDTSTTSNFNAHNIPAGDTIWFSTVIQWSGTMHPDPGASTIQVRDYERFTFTLPDGKQFVTPQVVGFVNFDSNVKNATTVWLSGTCGGTNPCPRWETTVPMGYSGDVFADGYGYVVGAGGIPGGTKVTAVVELDTGSHCLSVNWKWAAAVYTTFSTNYSGLGVKPVDSNSLSVYLNSHHAGTPENFTSYLAAGARGGGGSNFTGSYSGTAAAKGGTCP